MQFLMCVPVFYRPHLDFLVMTGLSASEMAGLRKEDVSERYITLQRSIVLGVEKEKLENDYRFRRIPMAEAIKRVIDQMRMQCSDHPYLFPMDDNSPFDGNCVPQGGMEQSPEGITDSP